MAKLILGVIFDMDGTICDSEPLHAAAWMDVLPGFGLNFPREWFLDWVGRSDEGLAEYLVARHPGPATFEQYLVAKRDRYRALVREQLRPLPGLLPRLERLRAAGLPFALCTSSNNEDTDNTLATLDLTADFPVRVTYDDVDLHKPDPAPYLLAARRLGLEPAACAAVEDSPAGVASAAAAGCLVCAVTTSHARAQLPGVRHYFPHAPAAVDWLLAGAARSLVAE